MVDYYGIFCCSLRFFSFVFPSFMSFSEDMFKLKKKKHKDTYIKIIP